MTVNEVLELVRSTGVEAVDFRFMDFPGLWQHFTIPASGLEADTFTNGLGFDGSSMRGWKGIEESDMLIVPDPETAWIDPFPKMKTLVLICDVKDPITHEPYARDPRNIARKAEEFLRGSGIGDDCYCGPEAEFFIFDDIRFDQNEHSGYYFVDSIEGRWNTGRDEGPNLGYKPRYKEGYFPVPPTDKHHDLRNEMMQNLINCGLDIECQHHEVATAGQSEIDIKYAPLKIAADQLMTYKYIVKNTALQHGKSVTFMPKPVWNDNGSGMHVHLSIWKNGINQFAGDGYAGMSEMATYAIGGILQHAPALVALTNPTTNSYKRLVPGFEAPTRLAYSSRNRSAAVRIPVTASSASARRFEFRCPDPSCNPYLAFSALMMAAVDGIKNKIDPGEPLDKDLYDLPAEQLAGVPCTPGSLDEALVELEKDHEFLLAGDVFTSDAIRTWVDYKREKEVDELRLRPHPYEFALYYDI
ncbi:MAG: type I glutamate--ammonia ligase [Planctomycetota bacterium]|nr:type I glutamate--ammonia ligase [Planctomycetota bacterium]